MQDLRAYLRFSVVSGRLADEIDAHTVLARVYSRAGEFGLAAAHYIRSGDARGAESLLAATPSFVDCSKELARHAPWEQATTLAALAAQGDLVPDEQVDTLARHALERLPGVRQGPFGPWVWLNAYKLLAALGSRLPADMVDPLLNALEPQINRESNHYRYNDDEHVQIVAALHIEHPEHRKRTSEHLVALMAESPELGGSVIKYGRGAIEVRSEDLLTGLRVLGSGGNEAALSALLLLEEDHPLLVERATKLLEKALDRPDRTPRQYTIGSDLPHTATFVRLLQEDDRTRLSDLAITIAEDDSEMEVNRTDALAAIMVLARSLPAEGRTLLFRRTMSLAREPSYSETDEALKAGLHPLSAFHVDIGFGSLVPQAVHTAAALAQNKHEFDEVTHEALVLLRSGSEVAANQAAHALAALPPEELTIDLRFLASSPVRWVRQLAGISWCSRPDDFPDLGQAIASDPDRMVRQSLAGALPRLDTRRPDLAADLRRQLAKDPSAAVRWELEHPRPAP